MNDHYYNLSNTELSIDFPLVLEKKFRPAILIMFVLVLVILLGGNFWAGDEFKNAIKEQHKKTTYELSDVNSTLTSNRRTSQTITKTNSVGPTQAKQKNEPAVLPVTYCAILFIIIFAVGWLLLLYYFPKVMIYIIQVVFCIGAFSSLLSCLDRLSFFLPILRRYSIPSCTIRKPCVYKIGSLNIFTLFAILISLTLVIIWYVYRQTGWAWVLQDILGAAVCITVLSVYRLGNMRVVTIILIAFFLYDIFFVFITPYIPIFQQSSTSSNSNTNSSGVLPSREGSSSSNSQTVSRAQSRNPSVMEQVALGIGTNGEVVPLLFVLPMFIPENELDPCSTVKHSMLGFGDVILPGIVLTFCKIFDIASNNRWPIYYIQSIISYFVGLTLTHVALYLMNTAQPALLYLVPCLLLSTIITGLCRRELKELYTGKRIKAALARVSQNGIENPIGPGVNDETPRSDITIDANDSNIANRY